MNESRNKFIKEYLAEIKKILTACESDLIENIDKLADALNTARENKNTIFLMGNGGSAATASHGAADFSKGAMVEGKPRFKAIALTDSTPNIMAWANDSSYDDVFVQQLMNLMEAEDIVIGISGSGNSMNVIKAIDYANDHGAITVGLSAYDGGKLLHKAKINIHIPVNYMQRAEDIHALVLHLLTSLLREEK